MCNYNDTIILPLPDYLKQYRPNNPVDVCIDRCITEHILHLWDNEIHTLGCCCGHDKILASLVITEGYRDEEIARILKLLRDVDDTFWEIWQWRVSVVATTKENLGG